jgi:hypothetical protein
VPLKDQWNGSVSGASRTCVWTSTIFMAVDR